MELSKGTGQISWRFSLENILYNQKNKKFLFLDWRQDFNGNLEIGDLYYDLSKLLHGLIVEHNHSKKFIFN